MTGNAIALTGLAGLEVNLPGEDWSFLIRRVDFAADPGFASHHGKEVHARDLLRLLPNWASLSWAQVPDNILSTSESCGRDAQYQVSVRAQPGSGKQHQEVIAAFLRFMSQPDPSA